MKAAFFFDTILYQDKTDYYGMTLTYEFFKTRYLINFNEIEVCTRAKKINKAKGNISGYKKANGKNVTITPIEYYNDVPDSIKNYKKIYTEIESIVDRNDIIIIRMPSIIGNFACKIANKKKKKYIIEVVACAWDIYINHARFGGKILAPIMYIMTKKNIQKAQNVLYVTNSFLQKRYPNKNNTLGCSDVILPIENKQVLKNRLKKIDNIENTKNLKLVTVANVELKYKGQKYVIKAIHNLSKKGYNFNYYLIGNGNNNKLKKTVEKYNLNESIHFLGSLPHDEIFNKLDEMDLYIQPSLTEGLPRALLEAMSRGCPCIGTTAGGIPELINKKMTFKKKKIIELENILINLTKEQLRTEATSNFNTSKKYNPESLENQRNDFYKNI